MLNNKKCLLKDDVSSANICFRILLIVISIWGCNTTAVAQSAVTGMKANGRIMNSGDTVNVCIGSRILYESLAQGSLTWQFNLGSPAIGSGASNFNITYNTPGIDSTIQTAVSGIDTVKMFVIIKVNDLKPKANFTYVQTDSCGNIPIVFNSSNSISNADPLSYRWTFETGKTSNIANPSHQFLNATGASGTQPYPVKLVVTNALNCADSITQTVTVKRIPDASLGNADPNEINGPYDYNGTLTFARCVSSASYAFKFRNNSTTAGINTRYKINWAMALLIVRLQTGLLLTLLHTTIPLGSIL